MNKLILKSIQDSLTQKDIQNKICFSFVDSNEEIYYLEFYKKVFNYVKIIKDNLENKSPVIAVIKMDIDSICLIVACLLSGVIPVIKNFDSNQERNKFKINNFINTNPIFNTIISTFPIDENDFSNCNIINVNNSDNKIKYDVSKIDIDNGFIFQETSGTCSESKLVLMTEDQIMTSMEAAGKDLDSNFINLSYLPFSHIFGLISAILFTIYKKGTTYVMLPGNFKNNPDKYLDIIKEKKVNYLSMTNFGLNHLINSYSKDHDYNLESLSTIHIGGDITGYNLIKQFYDTYKNHGLKKEVFVPIYGMTEMGGLISYNANRDTIDEKPIEGVSSCGIPEESYVKILLKNEDLIEEPKEGMSGELLVNSKNLFKDYFNTQISGEFVYYNNEKYFCTGDIAVVHNNRLYIVSRKKNILVKNSNKYSPFALETIIADLKKDTPLLNSYFISVDNQVVLFQEVIPNETYNMNFDDIKKSILARIKNYYNLDLDDIIFISPSKVPKTELGKVKRKELIKKYQEHNYD